MVRVFKAYMIYARQRTQHFRTYMCLHQHGRLLVNTPFRNHYNPRINQRNKSLGKAMHVQR